MTKVVKFKKRETALELSSYDAALFEHTRKLIFWSDLRGALAFLTLIGGSVAYWMFMALMLPMASKYIVP